MKEEYKELKLFNRTEAAEAMSIGRDALAKLINQGQIGVIQIGGRWMISYREIQRYIEENTIIANQITKGKINLEAFRETVNTRPTFDSAHLLTKLMESENVKYIS